MIIARPAFAFFLLAAAAPAARAAGAEPQTTDLATVVVVGSRAPEPLQQVVGSVTVIDRAELENHGVIGISDLVRLVPGLAVPVDSARFGQLGFNLRGLEGNRVSVEIDGVPLPDGFSVGQFALAGRDLADMQAIERIEVLRGPASTLYGSKALAGVVAYTTRTPDDILDPGDDFGGAARIGYASRDRGNLFGASAAARQGDWSAMVLLARRDAHELRNKPRAGGLASNPARTRRDGVLAKLVHGADENNRLSVTFEDTQGRQQTDVRSLVHAPGRYLTTTALDADDAWERTRASLAWHVEPTGALLDVLDAHIYRQRASVVQDTFQHRDADAQTRYPTLRERRFDLTQTSIGAKLVGQKRNAWLGLEHWQVFGLDLAEHDYRSLRDGREINLATGASSNVVLGEVFPVRDFPLSRVHEAGLFWQDEIRFGESWAVVPGLRGERYGMRARSDAIWHEDNPKDVPVSITSTRWTPKLGLRRLLGAHGAIYLQVVKGYRAPPFSDVNIGLYLPTLNYRVLPNPNLRAETSVGTEAGLRLEEGAWRINLALYDNRFRDLIESRANLGVDPATGMLAFQSVNRDRARIRGAELDLRWQPLARPAWDGWFVEARASASRGDDTARQRPLNTIQPARATLGVGHESLRGSGARLSMTGVAAKNRVDDSAGAIFRPRGYATLDAAAWWQPNDAIRLNLTLGNLANRRYYDWASLRGIAPNARDLDLYTLPGRNAAIDLTVRW